ncbi:hypothetical protein OHV05_35640 (plasmid) [Kitasatospora sp. NBC_00070]|uniref:hypothetical protein n=1 Tax=Kitasatospora sp. NBC_00070 TaxID=2975962 RepID=UPI002F914150
MEEKKITKAPTAKYRIVTESEFALHFSEGEKGIFVYATGRIAGWDDESGRWIYVDRDQEPAVIGDPFEYREQDYYNFESGLDVRLVPIDKISTIDAHGNSIGEVESAKMGRLEFGMTYGETIPPIRVEGSRLGGYEYMLVDGRNRIQASINRKFKRIPVTRTDL